MKKTILFLVMTATIATSVFANGDPEVNSRILKSFKNDFTLAKNINWSQNGGYMKARFTLSEMQIEAFYTQEGRLAGSCRDLSFQQLPLSAIVNFNKDFEEASVSRILEVTNESGTSYRIWLQKNNSPLKITISSEGNIARVNKVIGH